MKIDTTIKIQVENMDLSLNCSLRESSNELVLFIHGAGDTKEDFNGVWDRPEFANYSLVSYDCIGFGKSSKPTEFTYSIESHANCAMQLLEQLGYKKIHIVAHSVGGAIALLLAKKLSDGILISFINIEGNLIGDDCGIVTRNTISVPFEEYRDILHPQRSARLIKTRGTDYPNKVLLPLAFYKTAQSVVALSDSGLLLETFHEIDCKKLYMYGEENRLIPVIKKLKDIPTIEIPNAGHRPMDDNPDEYYKAISNFQKN